MMQDRQCHGASQPRRGHEQSRAVWPLVKEDPNNFACYSRWNYGRTQCLGVRRLFRTDKLQGPTLLQEREQQGQQRYRRMNDLRFYVLFNSISVIPGRCSDDNERLCAMELRLRLRRITSTEDRTRSARSVGQRLTN